MALYTTQLRTICESSLGLTEPVGFDDLNEMVTKAAPLVFNFDFPIYDENYRLTLERKILKHYYMREIGAETVGLWKLYLDERLNLIMPYYNELYKTTLYKFNPLYDVDLTTEHDGGSKKIGVNSAQDERENQKTGKRDNISTKNEHDDRTKTANNITDITNHTEDTGESVSRYSETPQGSIRDLAADRYLTNATIDNTHNVSDGTQHRVDKINENDENKLQSIEQDKAHTTDTENEKSNRISRDKIDTTEKYIQHVSGANGSRTLAYKIMEFRNAILNIDRMIIEELSDLFLGLWG